MYVAGSDGTVAISGEYPGTAWAPLSSSLEGQSAMLAKCRCGLYYVPASMYMYMYMYDVCHFYPNCYSIILL